jgi:hypothetical protein
VLKGKYTTKRDGGLEYTYEAESGMVGQAQRDWHWVAKVRRNGHLAGTPSGMVKNAKSFVEDPMLRRMVESAIEDRVGVD